jgi:hypothetical protein
MHSSRVLPWPVGSCCGEISGRNRVVIGGATPTGAHSNRSEQISDISFDGLPAVVGQILRDSAIFAGIRQSGQVDVETELPPGVDERLGGLQLECGPGGHVIAGETTARRTDRRDIV